MSCENRRKLGVTADSFITNYKVNSIVYNTSAAFVSEYKFKPRSVNSSIYKPAQNETEHWHVGAENLQAFEFFGRFFWFHIQSRCKKQQRNLNHKTKLNHKTHFMLIHSTECNERAPRGDVLVLLKMI